MIIATVTGNIGKDPEVRQVGDGSVLSFGVASNKKDRNGDVATWVDCSIWGRRGESLSQYLSKGTKVTVVGELSTREHNGKTYLQLRVDQLDFAGPSRSEQRARRNDVEPPATPDDDDIPF